MEQVLPVFEKFLQKIRFECKVSGSMPKLDTMWMPLKSWLNYLNY